MNRARNHIRAHRRQVAVLFADLSGFTGLVESVDPEMVYEVVRPLMDDLVRLVRAHSGDIQQVLGDGFMAVFGLHSQDGDEAVRALNAGVALVAAGSRRAGLPVHVGIECGEVLVSSSWEPAGFGVWGRAVTLAKRLCDLAGPGAVHIGPRAFELAGQVVECGSPISAHLEGIVGDVLVRPVVTSSSRPMALAGSTPLPGFAQRLPRRVATGPAHT